jgi:hypothetical protein
MSRRIGLCIGVAHYQAPALALSNPINDARRIDATLKARGFDSTLLLDPTADQLTQALADLRAKVDACAHEQTFAVVFYAGHAIELGGFGAVLPADTPDPVTPGSVRLRGISVLEIVGALEAVRGPKVVIIDACRNAVDGWGETDVLHFNAWAKQEVKRLQNAAAAEHVAIAYSTAAGQQAFDGAGARSLYCDKLAAALLRHDLTLVEALTQCGQDVIADTQAKQRPWVYTNLSTKASFSDLPSYALASSTTLTKAQAPGTRLMVRAMDDALAVNLNGRLQFLHDGEEADFVNHDASLTAAAVWKNEVLLAGSTRFVSLDLSSAVDDADLKASTVPSAQCKDVHGVTIAPDGAFAIVYGSGGYGIWKRTRSGWRPGFASKRPSEVYTAVFASDRVVYLGGSSDYVLRLTLSGRTPRVETIALGRTLDVYDLAWVRQRRSIAAVCNSGVTLWIDAAIGRVESHHLFEWPSTEVAGAYGRLRRMALSADEAALYLADRAQFDAQYGTQVWHRTHQEDRPQYHLLCCAMTADPRVLAIGADVGLIFLVDVRTGEHYATLDAGSDIGTPLQWMACSSGGTLHALGRDGTVRSFEPVQSLA